MLQIATCRKKPMLELMESDRDGVSGDEGGGEGEERRGEKRRLRWARVGGVAAASW